MRPDGWTSPRWEFDCGHCRFSWCCGPVCSCGRWKPRKGQMWFPVRVPGNTWLFRQDRLGAAEVKFGKLVKGARVEYRLGRRPEDGGQLYPAGKWTDGVLTGVTNRLRGQVWGFKVLSIRPVHRMRGHT